MTNSEARETLQDRYVSKDDGPTAFVTAEAGEDRIVASDELDFPDKAAFLSTFSVEEQKNIMRKVDWRIVSIIGLMSMIRQIDYNNAANVKVLQVGLKTNILKELKMTADEYNWVQSIFFIAYIIFEAPSNLLLKVMGPRTFQTRIMFSWGAVLACHAAVKNKQGLYAARFFLGVMEAGLFPGIVTHLCSWYRTDEMGKPLMWMYAFSNCSGITGSLLAFAISYMNKVGGLSAWKWVYLLEGLFTMLFAGVVWFVLPDYPKSPRSAKWLTPREQSFIEARLTENAPKTHDAAFSAAETFQALKDPRMWSFMLAQLLIAFGGLGLSWWLPTITTGLGFAKLPRNQLLNIPPSALAVIGIVFARWFLKRAFIPRPLFAIILCFGMAICFILLLSLNSRIGVYFACIFGTAFYATFFVPFWAWRSSTIKGSTGAAFAIALQTSIAQVGGIVSPQMFRSEFAYNNYKVPFGVCAGSILLSLAANCLAWHLTKAAERDVHRNQKLRRGAEEGGPFVE